LVEVEKTRKEGEEAKRDEEIRIREEEYECSICTKKPSIKLSTWGK
jgi:hypothetical protein